MKPTHKNKTFSTFLAALFGGLGAHRFYLYGKKDLWAWVHILTLPISIFAGFIGALVIGLTPDEKWDTQHNAHSGRSSNSGWTVVLIVLFTFALGTTALIASIARGLDLYLTSGNFG